MSCKRKTNSQNIQTDFQQATALLKCHRLFTPKISKVKTSFFLKFYKCQIPYHRVRVFLVGDLSDKMPDVRFGSAGRRAYCRPRPDPVGNRCQEYQSELSASRTTGTLKSAVKLLRLAIRNSFHLNCHCITILVERVV